MDIGDLCDYCYEHNCKYCSLANPCLGCEDYDIENDECISDGGCGSNYMGMFKDPEDGGGS